MARYVLIVVMIMFTLFDSINLVNIINDTPNWPSTFVSGFFTLLFIGIYSVDFEAHIAKRQNL